jgi:hypothetical protein
MRYQLGALTAFPGQREKSALMKQLRYKAVRQKTPSSP